jgi:hypothetical protein
MKKSYLPPELIEYGTIDELTLGASGPSLDYTFSGGVLNVDNTNTNCSSNTGYCLTFAS